MFPFQSYSQSAAMEGNIEALLRLLLADPLILERVATSSTDTPLHVAAMLGHAGFVKELIKHKTNAVGYALELLLKYNTANPGVLQINVVNKSSLTALDLAVLVSGDSGYDDIENSSM
ncbi:Ankyrin repeat-containing protein [Melia azedarach]|uniref:Ankyrin repeat-containing protein n=1 Tax=Melia azedarach TaxID=155640 RepID=A0ACC1XMJ5_MELAZ|nr:Ankyrin repeat-containing protein [Melia azedarach]